MTNVVIRKELLLFEIRRQITRVVKTTLQHYYILSLKFLQLYIKLYFCARKRFKMGDLLQLPNFRSTEIIVIIKRIIHETFSNN